MRRLCKLLEIEKALLLCGYYWWLLNIFLSRMPFIAYIASLAFLSSKTLSLDRSSSLLLIVAVGIWWLLVEIPDVLLEPLPVEKAFLWLITNMGLVLRNIMSGAATTEWQFLSYSPIFFTITGCYYPSMALLPLDMLFLVMLTLDTKDLKLCPFTFKASKLNLFLPKSLIDFWYIYCVFCC